MDDDPKQSPPETKIEENPTEIPEAGEPSRSEETPIETEQKSQPEEKSQEEKPQSPEPPQESQQKELETKEVVKEVIKEVPVEVVKEVIKEVPIVDKDEVEKQVKEKLKAEQDERRKLANQARTEKKNDHLEKIVALAKEKKVISNDDVRDFLHVSQSTATNYLSMLVKNGKLKREGKHGGAKYSV